MHMSLMYCKKKNTCQTETTHCFERGCQLKLSKPAAVEKDHLLDISELLVKVLHPRCPFPTRIDYKGPFQKLMKLDPCLCEVGLHIKLQENVNPLEESIETDLKNYNKKPPQGKKLLQRYG